MFRSNKFICPYCYNKHSKNSCILKFEYDGIVGSKNTDGIISSECNRKRENCYNAKTIRFCPTKSQDGRIFEIPEKACENTFPIALIGGVESGKSTYLAVLIDEIRKKMSKNMECSFSFCNQQSKDTYMKAYYEPLYKNSTMLRITDIGDIEHPLMCSIDFYKANKIRDSIALSLYDGTEGCFLYDNVRYMPNAKGIIFLYDPLQLPLIQKKLKGKIPLPCPRVDQINILLGFLNLIKSQKKIKGKIDIPIAVVITKMDVLAKYNLLPNDSCLRMQSEHIAKGRFVKSDFEETNREIVALFEDFMEFELEQLVKYFTNYSFFGVSSLGENPDGLVLPGGEIKPIRVLDPLLWFLSLNKHIKTI